MKSFFEQNGGTYTKVGDYYIPDLEVPENHYEIRKYGRLRRNYFEKTSQRYIQLPCDVG